MKQRPTNCLAILTLAAMAANVLAVADPDAGSPYQRIVDRNVFGLKDPPPPPDPNEVAAPPPGKISLQGITTILGKKQVLMKVQMPPQPPNPAKELSLVLTEGQREGEIEVLEINEPAGTVKVRNAGVVQLLSLEKDAAKPSTGPVPTAAPPGLPGVPAPALPRPAAVPLSGGASGAATIGGSAALKTIPTRPVRTDTAGTGASYGVGAGRLGTATASVAGRQQQQPAMSLEEQTIMMEAQRVITADAVKAGDLPPLPPTDATHLLDSPPAPK